MVAPQRYGNFEIIDEIGRGGMGVVYRARQVSLSRTVALKVLPEANSAGQAAVRFEREAHAMAQLQHPNIVDVIEVGEEDGTPYFAMQFIDGEGLDAVLLREGRISPEKVAEIGAQVADALQHAHERGVIHRDIKPSNVLVAGDGRPVVTDFGIAKAVESVPDGLSLTQGAIGTPEYMSPEVIKGNPIDGRTDVYSLGVMLYHMVTGFAPFTATTPYQIADRHLREDPAPPSGMGANCPQWLESIILRAMAKDPSDRFISAAEMAAALRAARPVIAAPRQQAVHTTEIPHPVQTGSGTHQRLLLAVGAVGVVLIAAALGMFAHSRMQQTAPPSADITTNISSVQQPLQPMPQPSEATVPFVVGLSQMEAEQRLIEAGNFNVQYNTPRHSDAHAAGQIMSQHPEGGTVIEPGDLVTIVVSRGARPAPTQADHDAVRAVCYRWSDAWSAEDLYAYFACYSKSAQIYSNDRWYGYSEYLEHERSKFRQGDIRITIHDSIDTAVVDSDTIKATFDMTFERFGGSPYASAGRQTLTFDKTAGGEWMIVRDRFERY